ncbi:MAG: HlyD family efflux transporter periplasmic adaptor subunit [Candidatus Obscuribacterales bacterium]|nr:HlyD family efflux transporter periplasmic adaptor subunit [Candidatus Obscuribacterales bacterium]
MTSIQNKEPAALSPQAPHGNRRKKLILFIVILLLAGAAAYFLMRGGQNDSSKLMVSGRIEGYETNVGAKIGGRVDLISVREGELVSKGKLLVQISDDNVQAELRGKNAAIEKAKEQVEEARYQLEVIKSQITEGGLKVDQSQEESQGRISEAESNVAKFQAQFSEAEASLAQAKADLQLAQIRKERYDFLVSKMAVTKDERDQIATSYESNLALVSARQAGVLSAQKQLKAARGQLDQARSSRLSPGIQSAQLLASRKQLLQAEHQLKRAEHEVVNAEASRDETLANIAYLKILSPIDGVVTARAVEPGAVVVPGQTLLSLINLDTVYLRAYIPEGQIGKIRIGQKSLVYLDAKPNEPFDGEIIQVDPEGSFTPENIYFKDDRVRQVFGIKIAIRQPGKFAKPGMPADAQILLQ